MVIREQGEKRHSTFCKIPHSDFDDIIWVSTSVFHKKHFFQKQNRAYPHVSLWGIYNTDPKAFFVGTSLRGPTSK